MTTPTPGSVTVIFPAGAAVRGENAADVLARIGKAQWTPVDGDGAKRVLSDRVWAWNGSAVDPEQDDETFLQAIAASGMVRVLIESGS